MTLVGAKLVKFLLRMKLSAIVVTIFAIACLTGCGNSRIEQYMKPYNRLVQANATEREVIAQEGKPNGVANNERQLRPWLKRFKPRTDTKSVHVDGKVLIYYADPWHDSEGYVVYIFINKHGIANRTIFGGY